MRIRVSKAFINPEKLNARLGINGGSIEKQLATPPVTTAPATPSTPTPVTTPSQPTGQKETKEEEKDNQEQADDEGPDNPVVELENFQLWNDFHQFGTEMVITKTGRYVFNSNVD